MSKHGAYRKRRWWQTLLRVIGAVVGVVVLALVGLIAFLTLTEYKPTHVEPATQINRASATPPTLTTGREVRLLSWNIGYGALGDNADFFMDGGSGVITATKKRVEQNVAAVTDQIESMQPDLVLLQEVDRNSDRSSRIDQAQTIASHNAGMEALFATNYQTAFVPLGIPPYGKIDGGLLSLSSFATSDATRHALPNSYSWPMSTVQLKRCQLVCRIPVAGTNRELVLINEHPDAYTDEEHHSAQIDAIKQTMEEEAAAGNYVVVGGDWNASFSGVDISDYPLLSPDNWTAGTIDERDFEGSWQFFMDATHPTCRLLNHPLVDASGIPTSEPVQYYVLDGFIVSGNVRVVSCETIDLGFKASDHNPVVLTFALEGAAGA